MTLLQNEMILKIAHDEMSPLNGHPPNSVEDASTWADGIIETSQDKGVFTTLLTGDMVWHSGKGRDACVGLTEKGFAFYKTLMMEIPR